LRIARDVTDEIGVKADEAEVVNATPELWPDETRQVAVQGVVDGLIEARDRGAIPPIEREADDGL
jgi:hypothetical protein